MGRLRCRVLSISFHPVSDRLRRRGDLVHYRGQGIDPVTSCYLKANSPPSHSFASRYRLLLSPSWRRVATISLFCRLRGALPEPPDLGKAEVVGSARRRPQARQGSEKRRTARSPANFYRC